MFDLIALQPFHALSRSYIANCSTSPNQSFRRFFIKSEFAQKDDIGKIIQEFETMKTVSHPGLVNYTSITDSPENILIERPYIQGENLNNLITRNGPNSFEGAHYLSLRIAEAILYLHDQKIVVKNLTMNNIIITPDEDLKIVDFGYSAVANDANVKKDNQMAFNVFGPEGITEGRRITSMSLDVWNFGVLMFALFCGRMPFPGTNTMLVIQNILNKKLNFPEKISPKVTGLISSMLDPDPSKRPVMTDIVDMLRKMKKKKVMPANSYISGFPMVMPFQEKKLGLVNGNQKYSMHNIPADMAKIPKTRKRDVQ